MGKLILCSGTIANKPFHVQLTNTNIYSIEELCYFLYENIYAVTEEMFSQDLVVWLKNQASMPDIATKLEQLIRNKSSLKDIIVSVLCSCDYYTEGEIKELISIINEIENLSPVRKCKLKADNYLRYGKYTVAGKAYAELLGMEDINTLTDVEYGDVIHNHAIISLQIASFLEAAQFFKMAYEKNKRIETLYYYLCTLSLSGELEQFELVMRENNFGEKEKKELLKEIDLVKKGIKETKEYQKIRKLKQLKGENKKEEFEKEVSLLVANWKSEYRQIVIQRKELL